jgi:hypothetical protein
VLSSADRLPLGRNIKAKSVRELRDLGRVVGKEPT